MSSSADQFLVIWPNVMLYRKKSFTPEQMMLGWLKGPRPCWSGSEDSLIEIQWLLSDSIATSSYIFIQLSKVRILPK